MHTPKEAPTEAPSTTFEGTPSPASRVRESNRLHEVIIWPEDASGVSEGGKVRLGSVGLWYLATERCRRFLHASRKAGSMSATSPG